LGKAPPPKKKKKRKKRKIPLNVSANVREMRVEKKLKSAVGKETGSPKGLKRKRPSLGASSSTAKIVYL